VSKGYDLRVPESVEGSNAQLTTEQVNRSRFDQALEVVKA